jgi:hypothetical protein
MYLFHVQSIVLLLHIDLIFNYGSTFLTCMHKVVEQQNIVKKCPLDVHSRASDVDNGEMCCLM